MKYILLFTALVFSVPAWTDTNDVDANIELDVVSEDLAYDPDDEEFLNAEETPVYADPNKVAELQQQKPKAEAKSSSSTNVIKK